MLYRSTGKVKYSSYNSKITTKPYEFNEDTADLSKYSVNMNFFFNAHCISILMRKIVHNSFYGSYEYLLEHLHI